MEAFIQDACKYSYTVDDEFKEVFQQLQIQCHVHDGDNTIDYNLQNELLYRLDKLCVVKCD